MRVLFIGGVGRSGTTLLERLLGELTGVCSLGEVTQLWTRVRRSDKRCGCGSSFAECEFWTEVGERAFGGWDNVDLGRVPLLQRRVGRTRHVMWRLGPRLSDDLQAQINEYTSYYTRVYTAAAEVADARLVVDSSKNPGLAFCLRQAPDLDLRMVHLVRDPRGVAFSLSKHTPNPERDSGLNMRMSPLASAVQWTVNNGVMGLIAAAGRRSGGLATAESPVRRIRYEDLLDNPTGTIRAVARFAGLNLNEESFSYLNERRADLGTIHSAGGNTMRFVNGPVPLRRDEAWLTALPPRHRSLVSALCLPLIMAYGYPAFARASAGRRTDSRPHAAKPPRLGPK